LEVTLNPGDTGDTVFGLMCYFQNHQHYAGLTADGDYTIRCTMPRTKRTSSGRRHPM
jgi:hypothetical protein